MRPLLKIALTALIGISIVIAYRIHQNRQANNKKRVVKKKNGLTRKLKKSSEKKSRPTKEEKKVTGSNELRATGSDILHPLPFDNVTGTMTVPRAPDQAEDKKEDLRSSEEFGSVESHSTNRLVGSRTDSEFLEIQQMPYSFENCAKFEPAKKKEKGVDESKGSNEEPGTVAEPVKQSDSAAQDKKDSAPGENAIKPASVSLAPSSAPASVEAPAPVPAETPKPSSDASAPLYAPQDAPVPTPAPTSSGAPAPAPALVPAIAPAPNQEPVPDSAPIVAQTPADAPVLTPTTAAAPSLAPISSETPPAAPMSSDAPAPTLVLAPTASEIPSDAPAAVPVPVSASSAIPILSDAPADASTKVLTPTVAPTPTEAPSDVPAATPIPAAAPTSSEAPSDGPALVPVDFKKAQSPKSSGNLSFEMEIETTSPRTHDPAASLVESDSNRTSDSSTSNDMFHTLYKICRCRKKDRNALLEDSAAPVYNPRVKPEFPQTKVLPVNFYTYNPPNLLESKSGGSGEEIMELPDQYFAKRESPPDNYLTGLFPMLGAIHAAHSHACLITHLVDNYDFFE